MKSKKGDWVLVHNVVLQKEERAPQVPEDTKQVPLKMWVKGFINEDANLGDQVSITTISGRTVKGELVDINPYYKHDYGKCIPEILQIGIQLREILSGGEENE
ncbi:2-amino-4-oxopentanoate thiolase subunit OrtA [Alkalithermobacter thermoalcaliphilus]